MLLKTYLKRILAERTSTSLFGENEISRKDQSLILIGLISTPFFYNSITYLSFCSGFKEQQARIIRLFLKHKTERYQYVRGKEFPRPESSLMKYFDAYGTDPDIQLLQKENFEFKPHE